MIRASAAQPWLDLRGEPVASHLWNFAIGGISLQILCHHDNPAMMSPGLQPFQTAVACSDVQVTVKKVPDLIRSSSHRLFDSGATWTLFQSCDGFAFDFSDASLRGCPLKRLLIDEQFTSGTLQISERVFRPYAESLSPLAYPLDELLIMHRLTQERAIELHGTGIVRANGVANLFVGHSGAGKSTTTRLWTSREEVEVLSDDRIIVRYDDGRDGPAGATQMRMYGTPWHGEAMFASPNSAPLTRIFVLEHGQGNVITRLSRSEAVGELFARAFVPFHRHEYIENALSFLEQLVSSVPCYRYLFEPDERAVEKIQQFND